jgi:hypothetical protein
MRASHFGAGRESVRQNHYDDSGTSPGASRFFPTFRYEAKAPGWERPRVNGVAHPTVKPLELIRWLVRLVTPPSGLVLDMFAGSGTTVEAALMEGFDVVGVEQDAGYLPLIHARVERARIRKQPGMALYGRVKPKPQADGSRPPPRRNRSPYTNSAPTPGGKPIAVGAERGYPRRTDVWMQLEQKCTCTRSSRTRCVMPVVSLLRLKINPSWRADPVDGITGEEDQERGEEQHPAWCAHRWPHNGRECSAHTGATVDARRTARARAISRWAS